MNDYLQHMRIKIKEQAGQIAQLISKGQGEKYAVLHRHEKMLHPARETMVNLYADTLIMSEVERIETIKKWGEKAGTRLTKYDRVGLEMMFHEVPTFRSRIGEVIRYEAEKIGLSAGEMYDLMSVLDQSLSESLYYFSVPCVQFEKDRLLLSQNLVTELSVPLVSINNQTAILPLIGTVDHDRALVLQERVLQNASELQLENLIIDLSGLQTTDTFVAQQLFNLFDALSLLGIQPIVSGISPAIAQTLVHLGLTFGRIKSFATLKQALAYLEN